MKAPLRHVQSYQSIRPYVCASMGVLDTVWRTVEREGGQKMQLRMVNSINCFVSEKDIMLVRVNTLVFNDAVFLTCLSS
jgi:hypothetical protein